MAGDRESKGRTPQHAISSGAVSHRFVVAYHPLTRNHDVEQSNSSKIPFYKGKSTNAPFQAFTTAGISEEVSARRRHPVGAAELIAGKPVAKRSQRPTAETLAQTIVMLAKQGERDPVRLEQRAVEIMSGQSPGLDRST